LEFVRFCIHRKSAQFRLDKDFAGSVKNDKEVKKQEVMILLRGAKRLYIFCGSRVSLKHGQAELVACKRGCLT